MPLLVFGQTGHPQLRLLQLHRLTTQCNTLLLLAVAVAALVKVVLEQRAAAVLVDLGLHLVFLFRRVLL
jgi:hypothetical protein